MSVSLELKAIAGFLGAVGAAALAVWTSIELAVQTLLALMVLDLVSGLIAGYKGRALDSAVGTAGWRRKALTLIFVAAVAVGGGSLGAGALALQTVAGGFALIEFLSIVENAGRAGVRFPRAVQDYLVKLQDQASAPAPAPTKPAAPRTWSRQP